MQAAQAAGRVMAGHVTLTAVLGLPVRNTDGCNERQRWHRCMQEHAIKRRLQHLATSKGPNRLGFLRRF
jgi:hypothetical protein